MKLQRGVSLFFKEFWKKKRRKWESSSVSITLLCCFFLLFCCSIVCSPGFAFRLLQTDGAVLSFAGDSHIQSVVAAIVANVWKTYRLVSVSFSSFAVRTEDPTPRGQQWMQSCERDNGGRDEQERIRRKGVEVESSEEDRGHARSFFVPHFSSWSSAALFVFGAGPRALFLFPILLLICFFSLTIFSWFRLSPFLSSPSLCLRSS